MNQSQTQYDITTCMLLQQAWLYYKKGKLSWIELRIVLLGLLQLGDTDTKPDSTVVPRCLVCECGHIIPCNDLAHSVLIHTCRICRLENTGMLDNVLWMITEGSYSSKEFNRMIAEAIVIINRRDLWQ